MYSVCIAVLVGKDTPGSNAVVESLVLRVGVTCNVTLQTL